MVIFYICFKYKKIKTEKQKQAKSDNIVGFKINKKIHISETKDR